MEGGSTWKGIDELDAACDSGDGWILNWVPDGSMMVLAEKCMWICKSRRKRRMVGAAPLQIC